MDIQESLCTCGAQVTTVLRLYSLYLRKLFRVMDFPHVSVAIRVVKMLMCHAMFMLSHPLRGPGRGSVLVGKSVHNQRVERLWRDVYQGVVGLYYALFTYLEEINILDPNNDIHLFCLHYIFIPRINRHLEMWRMAWIKHPIRTERNMTPEQLYTAGLQTIAYSNCQIAREIFENLNEVHVKLTAISVVVIPVCYRRMKGNSTVLIGMDQYLTMMVVMIQ